jgi:MFS family permease
MLRLGRRATMVVGVAAAALGVAAIPFSPNLLLLGVASACYGVGEAVLNPVVNDAVAAFADPAQRAGIMSGLQISKNGALTVAPAVVGAMISATGFRVAFVATALLGVGFAAYVLLAYAPPAGTFEGE